MPIFAVGLFKDTMVCTYRVTLEGIKGFFRVYKISGNNSLYTFHKQLRADLEFTVDQPILFKAFDEAGNVVARYALTDLGYGSVDKVSIAKTIADGVVKFVYFYDIAARKSVTVTLEAQETGEIDGPVLTDSKGPIPLEFENGYVAFEDLPQQRRRLPGEGSASDDDDDDDDDDDEEDEDEDDDKEEIVYEEEN